MRAAPTNRASVPHSRTSSTTTRQQRHLSASDEDITAEAVQEGLSAVFSVKLARPVFDGATRTKLGNPEAGAYVQEVVRQHLTDWLERNPSEGAAIVRRILNSSTG